MERGGLERTLYALVSNSDCFDGSEESVTVVNYADGQMFILNRLF